MGKTAQLTTFLPQDGVSSLSPFNDSQRIYSDEHDLSVYGCTSSPHERSFQILDIPQRRWYEVNIFNVSQSTWPPPPLSDDEAQNIENLARKYISDSFNTINIDQDGNVTYDMKPSVGIPLRKQPVVSNCIFPTVDSAEITNKQYFFRAIDTCLWNNTSCFYKQIEFDDMIRHIEREITVREVLVRHFNLSHHSQLSRLGVAPLLAVVVKQQPEVLTGILLPDVGISLARAPAGLIKIEHLVLLVVAVKYLLAAQTLHGDICERNVCIKGSKLHLIDFGEVAPNYQGDKIATGDLLLWCVDRMELGSVEKTRVINAGKELTRDGDLDSALKLLM